MSINEKELRIASLERQVLGEKEAQARMEAIVRLFRNKDFKKVILEDYAVKDCARYTRESADPLLTPVQQADALAMAQASGHLLRYLNMGDMFGQGSAEKIVELQHEIDYLRSQPDEENEE